MNTPNLLMCIREESFTQSRHVSLHSRQPSRLSQPPKLHIPSTINTEKELPRGDIWAGKKWASKTKFFKTI